MTHLFDAIPEDQLIQADWRQDERLQQLARTARAGWSLPYEARFVLTLASKLEAADERLAELEKQNAALTTVNDELSKRTKGLEMTIGRMKKRKEDE